MSPVRIIAPAKVNLGLAVLGKRPDGYHNIDTIMAMLDLADVLTISPANEPVITIAGMDDVPVETNLITRAILGFCERTGVTPEFHVDILKRIPSPSGLGGGSSDAAAALKALVTMFPGVLGDAELHGLATSIGADCPFFLGTPVARATGIGTTLRPLSAHAGWAVIVVPQSTIQAKTAMLYGALNAEDYVPAEAIDLIEHNLNAGRSPILVNSFTRAARMLIPAVNLAWEAVEDVTGMAALSGAGPSVYALARDERQAHTWREELERQLPAGYAIVASRFLTEVPQPEPLP